MLKCRASDKRQAGAMKEVIETIGQLQAVGAITIVSLAALAVAFRALGRRK
jgi:hypothetical protein